MESHYVGTELELFAGARNWKSYWSSLLRPSLGRRILDVGAGIGATARLFPDHPFEHYLALEPDAALAAQIGQAQGAGGLPANLQVQVGTSADVSAELRFDTILYVDVLEHIDDDVGELARAEALLAPGGKIIVLAPAHQWLYSPFDEAVGHVRRYNRASLLAAKPPTLQAERIFYLDSVGLLASLANRWALRASVPSARQIALWDRAMVPVSKLLDPALRFAAGKTIIGIFQRPLQ
jgi:SAM-dependent methyltransferase